MTCIDIIDVPYGIFKTTSLLIGPFGITLGAYFP